MGHGLSICCATYVDTGAGSGVVEKSRCERGCVVADYIVYYALPRSCYCFQHLLRKATSSNGGNIHGGSCCWLFCVYDRAVGH